MTQISGHLALRTAFAALLDHPQPPQPPPFASNSKGPQVPPSDSQSGSNSKSYGTPTVDQRVLTPAVLSKAVAMVVQASRADDSGAKVMWMEQQMFVHLNMEWNQTPGRYWCDLPQRRYRPVFGLRKALDQPHGPPGGSWTAATLCRASTSSGRHHGGKTCAGEKWGVAVESAAGGHRACLWLGKEVWQNARELLGRGVCGLGLATYGSAL